MISQETLALLSYTVDEDGYIHFPFIDSLSVDDLTLSQASAKLQEKLSNYLNQPMVTMKFVNKSITVVGEVNRPGTYSYSDENINLFQALSLAGDITDFGNRKNVVLMRSIDGEESVTYNIDLTDDKVFTQKNFYLRHGDIIYVRQLRTKRFSYIYQPLTLVFSTITTVLVVMEFVRGTN